MKRIVVPGTAVRDGTGPQLAEWKEPGGRAGRFRPPVRCRFRCSHRPDFLLVSMTPEPPNKKMIAESKKESDGSVTLQVKVDTLDRTNALEFREEAARAVGLSDGVVRVDCSRLEFIDSSGLGAFLHIHNLLPEARRPVRLTHVGSKVLTVLELMQVHRIFDLDAGL